MVTDMYVKHVVETYSLAGTVGVAHHPLNLNTIIPCYGSGQRPQFVLQAAPIIPARNFIVRCVDGIKLYIQKSIDGV